MAGTSIVMVSYHTGSALFHAIDCALAQEGLHRLVLVDNGNPTEVCAQLGELASREPRMILLSGHGNIGFAKACNVGARHAEGKYLLLLNPDCLLPKGALLHMAGALETHGAMLAGCLMLNPDGNEQRGSRRQLLTPITALSESLALHRFFKLKRLNEHETILPAQAIEVPAISGAFMFLRQADFEALGGMDEGYFLHVEDLDLC